MWNERYSKDGYLFGTKPAAALRAHAARLSSNANCLCVADGEGRNSVWLAEQGHSVTAWDASEVAVEKARNLAASKDVRVDFSVETAESFDWSANDYDAVVAIFIQFAGPDLRDRIFTGMKNATCPGGLIILHGYTPKQLEFGTGGPGRVENLYTADMLRALFDDFEIEYLNAYESFISEGVGHAGHSALVDLVARRSA